MNLRCLVIFGFAALVCFGADPSASEIMAKVAVNQDKAVQMRQAFVYQQHVVVATRHFNGKLAREEMADYDVAPGASSEEKKLKSISGKCQKGNHVIIFSGEPLPEKDSMDAGMVKSFRDDLLNDKDRDGVGKDLFPLTSDEQKVYRFELLGHKDVQGRDTYLVGFAPADSKDIDWAGEAWIDVEELQPVRVFTHLNRKLPFAVRTLLGTDVPGIGFNVQYKRVEKDVWFPVSFGSEFRLRAVFFIKRDITMSMEASGFKRAQVDSKVNYEGPSELTR
jgi:hypothetical protein